MAETVREDVIRKKRREAAERLREKQAKAEQREGEMARAEGQELKRFRREEAYATKVSSKQESRKMGREEGSGDRPRGR
eukprot:767688-Hanusia_phi.AAC.16